MVFKPELKETLKRLKRKDPELEALTKRKAGSEEQGGKMENEVMTVTEVAKYLKLCKNTVYEYVKAGKIPATHCGNMLRFSKRQVFEALERGFPAAPVKVSRQVAARAAPKARSVMEILDRSRYQAAPRAKPKKGKG
ncbi:MAG: helix-turn-helix domain-containing protein [Candidatus Ratteibacteria bacterium]|jgi:excisionase family DNA binding protein